MINTILFDVDGVLLSEERYFDASALTVWEMLMSPNYLGLSPEQFTTSPSDEEINKIRATVFQHDKVLTFQKSRGLNANWDMIYLSFCHQLIHLFSQIKDHELEKISKWCQAPIDRDVLIEIGRILRQYDVVLDFSKFVPEFESSQAMKEELFGHLNVLVKEKLGIETTAFAKGELWSVCEHACQEWYVGDEYIATSTGRPSVQTGKSGFLANETTLAPVGKIAKLFQSLVSAGYTIGVGTGRPELETIQPFQHLAWLHYFDESRIVTADDVLRAEKSYPDYGHLAKPHHFSFLRALQGKGTPIKNCLETPLPLENGGEVLIVGDSLADLLAARAMGCQFAAVLTGLSGKAAREEFEEQQADYILDSVIDVKDILYN
ncbi:HAD family hydrolase [Bacillus rubiinfantis]|uniref:HAD family hydrolase n=1 Tax=Bacillus rubiinfantis TaxID=1499680 RepID=UPI0005AA53FE|nr:HAD hydrolase-like protein [Bacillus rubiinfantis]